MAELTDALGRPIILGTWYGYSRSQGGSAHTTVGKAISATKEKVRLGECRVTHYRYGQLSQYRMDEKAADVSIRANMVFPVSPDQVRPE